MHTRTSPQAGMNIMKRLSGFENCSETLPQDIYWYEKGKVQHRLGNDSEAEKYLRTAVQLNPR